MSKSKKDKLGSSGGFVSDNEKIAKVLPVLEISTFSLDKPAAEVMKELGYQDPEELRMLRTQAGDLMEDPRVKAVLDGFIGPIHGMEVAQKQIHWVATEIQYRDFIQKFNEIKKDYFELDAKRRELLKEVEDAQADFISALRKYYIDPPENSTK